MSRSWLSPAPPIEVLHRVLRPGQPCVPSFSGEPVPDSSGKDKTLFHRLANAGCYIDQSIQTASTIHRRNKMRGVTQTVIDYDVPCLMIAKAYQNTGLPLQDVLAGDLKSFLPRMFLFGEHQEEWAYNGHDTSSQKHTDGLNPIKYRLSPSSSECLIPRSRQSFCVALKAFTEKSSRASMIWLSGSCTLKNKKSRQWIVSFTLPVRIQQRPILVDWQKFGKYEKRLT